MIKKDLNKDVFFSSAFSLESFKFNDKNIRVTHIKNVGQCFVGIDVSKAVGYNDDDNPRRAVRTHVPGKYRIRLGDAQNIFRKEVDTDLLPREDIVLLKEPGLYCFLLRCKKPNAKPFMEWVVETVLPQEVQKLASAIEENDAVIALKNDDLQDRYNQIQAIQYKNVALQAQRDIYQAELQRCQNVITHLGTRYVPHGKSPGKDNIIIIVRKHTAPANDKFHGLPYYVARIQRRKRYVKLKWFDRHYPDHEMIVEIDNPNSTHAFNRFEEEGHADRRCNYFKSIDLTREDLYTVGVPAILDDDEEKNFYNL